VKVEEKGTKTGLSQSARDLIRSAREGGGRGGGGENALYSPARNELEG